MNTKHVDETIRLLESLDADARKRVLAYLAARYCQVNGTSQLGGWIVALCAGRSFVGQRKEVPGVVRLSPVCEMARQLVQGPQGQTAIACAGMPPLLFGLDSLDLPEAGTVVIPFTQLSEEERSACMKAAASAEEMRKAMRAASAGIVLAGPGVKLPPLAGKP